MLSWSSSKQKTGYVRLVGVDPLRQLCAPKIAKFWIKDAEYKSLQAWTEADIEITLAEPVTFFVEGSFSGYAYAHFHVEGRKTGVVSMGYLVFQTSQMLTLAAGG